MTTPTSQPSALSDCCGAEIKPSLENSKWMICSECQKSCDPKREEADFIYTDENEHIYSMPDGHHDVTPIKMKIDKAQPEERGELPEEDVAKAKQMAEMVMPSSGWIDADGNPALSEELHTCRRCGQKVGDYHLHCAYIPTCPEVDNKTYKPLSDRTIDSFVSGMLQACQATQTEKREELPEGEQLIDEIDSAVVARQGTSGCDLDCKFDALRDAIRSIRSENEKLKEAYKIAESTIINHKHLVRGECIDECDLCETSKELESKFPSLHFPPKQ